MKRRRPLAPSPSLREPKIAEKRRQKFLHHPAFVKEISVERITTEIARMSCVHITSESGAGEHALGEAPGGAPFVAFSYRDYLFETDCGPFHAKSGNSI